MPTKHLPMRTTYSEDYSFKSNQPESRAQPIFPPNGERRNNPHPLQTFIVWRHPRPEIVRDDSKLEKANDPLGNLIYAKQLTSTYQSDYIETPPSEISRARKSKKVTLEATPFNSYSTVQCDFGKPPVSIAPQLLVPTTRYGSNVNKQKAATGAVPDVPKDIYMNRRGMTTYDIEFNEKRDIMGTHEVCNGDFKRENRSK